MARSTWSNKTQKMAVARPTSVRWKSIDYCDFVRRFRLPIFDMIYHGLRMTSEKLGRARPGKALLFCGTLILCMEGGPGLKEQQGNWLQNRRDPVAFFVRRVSYLEEKLEMTERERERMNG